MLRSRVFTAVLLVLCAVAGAKLVLVMGHTDCGALKGAIDGVELGNLTGLLDSIEPAVAAVDDITGERNSKNPSFVEAVASMNIRLTIQAIRSISPILRNLEAEGGDSNRRSAVPSGEQ